MVTDEQIRRAQLLRDEGMPAPWIAEDIGVTPAVVRRIAPSTADGQRAWLQSWAIIRHRRELRELHELFTPAARFHRP